MWSLKSGNDQGNIKVIIELPLNKDYSKIEDVKLQKNHEQTQVLLISGKREIFKKDINANNIIENATNESNFSMCIEISKDKDISYYYLDEKKKFIWNEDGHIEININYKKYFV